ncbi:hypothetical protein PMAYCL1PPCAC_26156, partial [Pristionchus mayeri]
GYLFMHTRTVHNEPCLNDRSLHYSVGIKSYLVAYEKMKAAQRKYDLGSFYEYDNRIWEISSKCLLIGFNCIIEKDITATPPRFYPGVEGDLRVPRENRTDFMVVNECYDCFSHQKCDKSRDGKFMCFCPEESLNLYPDPIHYDRDSEAGCK